MHQELQQLQENVIVLLISFGKITAAKLVLVQDAQQIITQEIDQAIHHKMEEGEILEMSHLKDKDSNKEDNNKVVKEEVEAEEIDK
jgi:hypothetical protein